MPVCVSLTILLMIPEKTQRCKHAQRQKTCPWSHLPSSSGSVVKRSHYVLPVSMGRGLFVRITTTYAEGRPWNEAAGSHPWLTLAFSVVWQHWHHEMSGLKMEMAQHCLGPIPGNASWIEALSLAAPSP